MTRILTVLVLLGLSACTSNSGGITATKMPVEASARLGDYRTFHLVAEKLPPFLGPVIVSNFSVAMAEKGYQPVTGGGDLKAVIAYEQDNLPLESEDVRFVARVAVTLSKADSGEAIISGSIQRLHTVHAGEFMHVGDASVSFLRAFREMVADLPQKSALASDLEQ